MDIPTASEYSCEDAEVTFKVASILCPRLDKEGLGDLFRDIELPLIPVLADMELAGVRIDTAYLNQISEEFAVILQNTEAQIYELAGEAFNINSPKQLAEILFNKLGMKATKKTKSGPSTSLDVLEELALEHEFRERFWTIVRFSSSSQLMSIPCQTWSIPETGRIHTSYNQAVAATGGSRPPIRICRTYLFGLKKVARSAKRLFRTKAMSLWLPTILR